MPRGGFKSIAVKEEDFDFFKSLWESNKSECRRQGVTTFSGFLTMMLYDTIEYYKKCQENESLALNPGRFIKNVIIPDL